MIKIFENDYSFSTITRAIGVFMGLFYMIAFNRYFGASLKGESAIILNYITLLSTFIDCGLSQCYAYFRKINENIQNIYIQNVMLIFISVLAICVSLLFLINDKHFVVVLIILPIRVLTNQFNSMVSIEYPRKRNYYVILSNLIDIVLVVIMVFTINRSFFILSLFLVVKEIICLVISILFVIGQLRIKFKFDYFSYYSKFLKFGFVLMACVLLMEINYRIDIIMLNKYVTVEAIGIYSLAVSISERVWLIPDALRDVLLSRLAKGSKSSEVAKICCISLWACVFSVVLFVIIGKPVINYLFGIEYEGAYSVMCLLLIGVIGMIFYKMIYAYFVIKGKQKLNMIVLLFVAFLNVICNLVMIPNWGINGAACASIIAYSICGLIFSILYCKDTNTSFIYLISLNRYI